MNSIFKIVAALKVVSLPKSLSGKPSQVHAPMTALTEIECKAIAGGDDSQTPRGGWKAA